MCDLELLETVSVIVGPCGAEHLLTVYLWVTSNRSMPPEAVQVKVSVVAVGVVALRLVTGSGRAVDV